MGNIDNETMLPDKLRVFVSRISPPLVIASTLGCLHPGVPMHL